MSVRVEFFGGPKDGERDDVPQVQAVLRFPVVSGGACHRYEWRATAQPAGYYYAGLGTC